MTNLAQSCSSADYCNAMCLIDTGHAIFTTWENLVTYRTHNLVFHSIRDALQFGFFKALKFLKKKFSNCCLSCNGENSQLYESHIFCACRKIHLPCRVLKLDFWGHLKHSGNAKLNPFSWWRYLFYRLSSAFFGW